MRWKDRSLFQGAIVQWLRDGLQIIDSAQETEGMASAMAGNNGVYMVPALTGLGAPHWSPMREGPSMASPATLARPILPALRWNRLPIRQMTCLPPLPVTAFRSRRAG